MVDSTKILAVVDSKDNPHQPWYGVNHLVAYVQSSNSQLMTSHAFVKPCNNAGESYTTFIPTLVIKEIKRMNWMSEWTKLIMCAAMQLWCTCISIGLWVSLTFKFLVNIFLTCWIRKSIDFWIRVTQLLLAGNATWLHPISLKIEWSHYNFTWSLWSHSLHESLPPILNLLAKWPMLSTTNQWGSEENWCSFYGKALIH